MTWNVERDAFAQTGVVPEILPTQGAAVVFDKRLSNVSTKSTMQLH